MTAATDPGYGSPDPGSGPPDFDQGGSEPRPGRGVPRANGARPPYTAGLRDLQHKAQSQFEPSGPEVTISFRTPSGARQQWQATVGRDRPGPAGTPELVRVVQPAGGTDRYIQKRVRSGKATIDTCAPLFNELQIGLHLARVFEGAYPPELGRVVGYDVDGDEPFLLLRQRG